MSKRKQEICNIPYGSLFGDTTQIRVIRQVIADPYGDYRPKELKALVEASSPSVRKVLKNLTCIGLLIKDTKNRQHPVYRVNVDSPLYIALNFLAFAIADHANHTYYMEDVIADYYDSELRSRYETDNAAPMRDFSDKDLLSQTPLFGQTASSEDGVSASTQGHSSRVNFVDDIDSHQMLTSLAVT